VLTPSQLVKKEESVELSEEAKARERELKALKEVAVELL
jgi:hypothetical protein